MHLLDREGIAAFSASLLEFEPWTQCGSGILTLELLRSEDARYASVS